jgi:hypothetical protein
MEFEGPSAVDYENVQSLNRAFLALLKRDPVCRRCLGALPSRQAGRLLGLSDHQAARLGRTPFLLFSLRERDDRFWEPVFADPGSRDLFAVPPSNSDELGRLIAAGLGFVWQLAKHNPYAARLICGASMHWCEQLTERTFLHVMALAGMQQDILTLRGAADVALWDQLLGSGVSREKAVRRAAHISALQRVLTSAAQPAGSRWATAARATRPPLLRVADDDS